MERLSRALSDWLGRPSAFWLAGILPVVLWAACGPFSDYSDTWQLVINTGTTVLTYLFMFLIQRAQNANSLAVQLKMDELIRVTDARNALVDVEQHSEAELLQMKAEL